MRVACGLGLLLAPAAAAPAAEEVPDDSIKVEEMEVEEPADKMINQVNVEDNTGAARKLYAVLKYEADKGNEAKAGDEATSDEVSCSCRGMSHA